METGTSYRQCRLVRNGTGFIPFLLALTIAAYTDAHAASLYSYAEFTESDFDTGIPVITTCFDESFTGAHTQCTGSYSPGGTTTINYNSSASADYGMFHAYSEQSVINGVQMYNDFTAAGAGRFRDQWAISGGATGTTGTLELEFKFSGTYSSSIQGALAATVLQLTNHNLNTIDTAYQYQPHSSAGTLSYTQVLSTEVTFGETLDFDVVMLAGTLLAGQRFDAGTLDASLDLSNSVVMSSIIVRDNSGVAIPFSLVTASGADLFYELSAVPLPAASWLFSSGLLGLIGIVRRRKTV